MEVNESHSRQTWGSTCQGCLSVGELEPTQGAGSQSQEAEGKAASTEEARVTQWLLQGQEGPGHTHNLIWDM